MKKLLILLLLPIFTYAQHFDAGCNCLMDIDTTLTIADTRATMQYLINNPITSDTIQMQLTSLKWGFFNTDSNLYQSAILFDDHDKLKSITGDTAVAIEIIIKHMRAVEHNLDSITTQYKKLSTLTGKFITGVPMPANLPYLPVYHRLYAHMVKNGWWFDCKPIKKK